PIPNPFAFIHIHRSLIYADFSVTSVLSVVNKAHVPNPMSALAKFERLGPNIGLLMPFSPLHLSALVSFLGARMSALARRDQKPFFPLRGPSCLGSTELAEVRVFVFKSPRKNANGCACKTREKW